MDRATGDRAALDEAPRYLIRDRDAALVQYTRVAFVRWESAIGRPPLGHPGKTAMRSALSDRSPSRMPHPFRTGAPHQESLSGRVNSQDGAMVSTFIQAMVG